MSLRIEHVPLSDVISNAANAIRPRAAIKSLTVEADNIYAGLVAVDPMRLKEVFYNLLSNAVKFTGRLQRHTRNRKRWGFRAHYGCRFGDRHSRGPAGAGF